MFVIDLSKINVFQITLCHPLMTHNTVPEARAPRFWIQYRIKPGYVILRVPIFSFNNIGLNVSATCSRTHCQKPSATEFSLISAQVTGVSGFLGSHVVDQLLKAGYRVRGWVISIVTCFRPLSSTRTDLEPPAPPKLPLFGRHSLPNLMEIA